MNKILSSTPGLTDMLLNDHLFRFPFGWARLKAICAAVFFGLLLSSGAQAADYDPRQVEVLAGSCANCHGTEGRLAGAIPAIANRPASVLEAQMLAFKNDQEARVTVMDRIAKGYSDEEIRALAEYFANLDNQ